MDLANAYDDENSDAESCLSRADPKDAFDPLHQGFPFAEVNSVRASERKIICCQFSPDGKHLASGGHDQKLVLWHVDTLRQYSVLEGHSSLVTDVCFNPVSPHFATSSFDKIVRVWDASCLGSPLWTFAGHSSQVMSLDFHSIIDGLLCSCDHHGEIRFWSIKNGGCVKAFKGGSEASQVRFQPRVGRYLAAATANLVSVFDVETQIRKYTLQGHTKQISYLCWNASGEYLASVSEDSVRVWSFGPESHSENCIHELNLYGRRFMSCAFHPSFASVLIIGCDKSLELWNTIENRITTIQAHEGLVAALAMSTFNGLVASASHDQFVKLWK